MLNIDDAASHAVDKNAAAPVTLKVFDGEIVGLVCGSFSLRSAIAKLLSGETATGSGRIQLAGRDVTGASPEARCRLGMIRLPAVTTLIPELTAAENVVLGCAPRPAPLYPRDGRLTYQQTAKAALEFAGLEASADMLAGQLPMNQKYALTVAIAAANKPSLLLVEDTGEPGSGAAAIGDLLLRLHEEGVAVLVLAARAGGLIEMCERIEYLQSPLVAGEGTRNARIVYRLYRDRHANWR
ncbi:MAG: ATP-binding cassette domain-containing protein [Rhodomicrobium sp.]|nr:ATP-binding cassette domain-containing protein [Rhodomicrobium sp.]